MKISDDNFCLTQFVAHVGRKYITLVVVVFRIVRKQDTQAIANRQPRCYNQKSIGKLPIVAVSEFVECMPCN